MNYDPLALVCASHRVRFVRYELRWADAMVFSHGCPVCVGLIRARVQLECSRDRHGRGRRKGTSMGNPFKQGAPPPTPAVTPAPAMPDPNSPANLAAQDLARKRANQFGRGATQLTTPTAPTLAAGGAYAGTKTGA